MSEQTGSTRAEIDWSQFDDESLGAAARGGSIEARNALFLRKRDQIRRLSGRAKRYLKAISWTYSESPLTHEDIDQQGFLVFCELLEEWAPGEQGFAACVIRRIPGRLLHYVRDTLKPNKSARMPLTERGTEELPDAPVRLPTQSPEHQVAWGEYTGDLPYRLKVAVTLRYWEDLPASKIAEVRGCTKRTVNRDLRRAHQLIRKKIEEEEADMKRQA